MASKNACALESQEKYYYYCSTDIKHFGTNFVILNINLKVSRDFPPGGLK